VDYSAPRINLQALFKVHTEASIEAGNQSFGRIVVYVCGDVQREALGDMFCNKG
jgi:hypothetical protein